MSFQDLWGIFSEKYVFIQAYIEESSKLHSADWIQNWKLLKLQKCDSSDTAVSHLKYKSSEDESNRTLKKRFN